MDQPDRSLRTLSAYRLRRTAVAVMAEFNKVFARFGLRRTTFSALTLIVDNPGMRQSQLAELLAIERPNLVQIVDELETAGLVQRETAQDDRRAYALQPTDAGREVRKKAMAAVRDCDADITRGLTPEQIAALHVSLEIIKKNANFTEIVDGIEISDA